MRFTRKLLWVSAVALLQLAINRSGPSLAVVAR